MRIVHCNVSDNGGGAHIAARRLHQGLQALGVDSRMAVLHKCTDDTSVIKVTSKLRYVLQPFISFMERLPLKLYRRRSPTTLFSPSWRPSLLHGTLNALDADILHLHWICDTFLPLHSLARLQRPVVWTLHDTWPFTGGCHYFEDCQGYQHNCGHCPVLGSQHAADLSRLEWHLKRWTYRRLCPTIVALSRAFAEQIKNSSLLGQCPVVQLPNPIDTEIFHPLPQDFARSALRLPQNVPLVLFGAMSSTSDPRKGFDLLRDALQTLAAASDLRPHCVIFGASHGDTGDIPFPVHFLGQLHDETALALAYSAADVFVCPSREESFSLTTLESLACGTPVAAFEVGGIPDMVEHQRSGWIAPCYDTQHLARGLAYLLENADRRAAMGEAARHKAVAEYALPVVARRYQELYASVLDRSPA